MSWLIPRLFKLAIVSTFSLNVPWSMKIPPHVLYPAPLPSDIEKDNRMSPPALKKWRALSYPSKSISISFSKIFRHSVTELVTVFPTDNEVNAGSTWLREFLAESNRLAAVLKNSAVTLSPWDTITSSWSVLLVLYVLKLMRLTISFVNEAVNFSFGCTCSTLSPPQPQRMSSCTAGSLLGPCSAWVSPNNSLTSDARLFRSSAVIFLRWIGIIVLRLQPQLYQFLFQ